MINTQVQMKSVAMYEKQKIKDRLYRKGCFDVSDHVGFKYNGLYSQWNIESTRLIFNIQTMLDLIFFGGGLNFENHTR